MFCVTQILEPLLYYCDIETYFHKICNYAQQYTWHNNCIIHKQQPCVGRRQFNKIEIFKHNRSIYYTAQNYYEWHMFDTRPLFGNGKSQRFYRDNDSTHDTFRNCVGYFSFSWVTFFNKYIYLDKYDDVDFTAGRGIIVESKDTCIKINFDRNLINLDRSMINFDHSMINFDHSMINIIRYPTFNNISPYKRVEITRTLKEITSYKIKLPIPYHDSLVIIIDSVNKVRYENMYLPHLIYQHKRLAP